MKAQRLKENIYITDIQPGFVKTKTASNPRFWVASPQKAASQIISAIDAKKWRVYITKRWWLIAWLMKYVPSWIYHRIRLTILLKISTFLLSHKTMHTC